MARPFRLSPSGSLWLLTLVLSVVDPVRAATVGNKVASTSAQAEEAYRRGEYEEALRLYRDAQLEDPDSPALHYNIGDALYKLQQYDVAAEEFKRVEPANGPVDLGSERWYNLGNSLFQQQQYAGAVEAFKNALLHNSSDMQAKSNLEMALERLQQQQQQSESGDGEGEEGEDEDTSSQESSSSPQQQESDEDGEEADGDASSRAPDDGSQQDQSSAEPTAEDEDHPDQAEDEVTGEMEEQEAEQLLEALRDREVEAQRRRFRVVPRGHKHDW